LLDLASGRSNQTVGMKWLPDTEELRIAVIGIEGREDFRTLPEEPVALKTPIGLEFTRTDPDGNSSPAVRFSITPALKRTAVNFDVRLMIPGDVAMMFNEYAASRFTVQQLGTVHDKISSEKAGLAKKQATAKGRERDELFQKTRVLDYRLWYLKFYTDTHKRAELHYRIFVEVDGREMVLATSTTKPIKPVKPDKPPE
jgi:hypothetical protein